MTTEHERGFESGYSSAIHDAGIPGSRAYAETRIARRKSGTCQDCGHVKPVRTVTFWATGMRYTVCAGCERPYRHSILWPVRT